MAKPPVISDSEWQVMNIIWDQQPVTASVIISQLAPTTDWSPATVRTFLHRLVKKGALKFETQGNRYVYRAAFSRNSTVKKASKSFLESVFGGETGPLIAHFVQSHRLSKDDVAKLRDLLDGKDSA